MRTVAVALLVSATACSHLPARLESAVELELKDTPVIEALMQLAGSSRINIFADSDLMQLEPLTVQLRSRSGEEGLAKLASLRNLRVEKLNVSGAQNASFWVSRESSTPAPETTFTGERITARFDEVPIREVARTLSDFAKIQVVVDDDVQSNITLHLRVPWDLALYHLGQKYELRIIRTDKLIRIAMPEGKKRW